MSVTEKSRLQGLALLLALLALAPRGARAQETDVCAIYAATLDSILPDTTKPVVVYDSVSLATPSFAFRAWTGIQLPGAQSKVPLPDSLWEHIRSTYRASREALPPCFGSGRPVTRLTYDSLIASFEDREHAWDQFRTRYPSAPGFLIVGRPYFLDGARTRALVYVAIAAHWLAGGGTMYYLERVNDQWRLVAWHTLWRS